MRDCLAIRVENQHNDEHPLILNTFIDTIEHSRNEQPKQRLIDILFKHMSIEQLKQLKTNFQTQQQHRICLQYETQKMFKKF